MSQKRSGKKHSVRSFSDITLNDFANATVPNNRSKKSSNNVTTVVKQEIESSWEDKDFDVEFAEQQNEDGSMSYVLKRSDPRIRKKTISSSCDGKNDLLAGNTYPIDIWYILSTYILPDDVATFACICRASFEVISTARYWFSLYRRFYSSKYKLPEQLQPECMVRKYGLKTSVVRALYIMYPPFINRVKSVITFEQHPATLHRRQCILVWYKKMKTQWIYYFKMKEKSYNRLPKCSNTFNQPDILEILDDVAANPDEHCRILQVTCLDFIPIPVVIGLTLSHASLTLAQGFQHYKLQLKFDSGINTTAKSAIESIYHIHLDFVVNVKILDWWHPLYPAHHSIGELCIDDTN